MFTKEEQNIGPHVKVHLKVLFNFEHTEKIKAMTC